MKIFPFFLARFKISSYLCTVKTKNNGVQMSPQTGGFFIAETIFIIKLIKVRVAAPYR